MTITIKHLTDPNGEKQVLKMITDIAIKGLQDDDYANLAERINGVMTILESIGVPHINNRMHITRGHVGQTITHARIVEELRDYPPILEMIANWKPVGAFRALFFYEKDSSGNQIIYFTQSVIKQKTFSQDFENAAAISKQMMIDFYNAKGGIVKWNSDQKK